MACNGESRFTALQPDLAGGTLLNAELPIPSKKTSEK
jgi:hypothetical protein